MERRAEQVLVELDAGLWLAEGDIVDFYGFPYPTRAVIAQLAQGELWVWSPIRLNDGLRDAVAELGTPAHLVSPNPIHHLYLQEWQAEWPSAKLWGPASTIRKRPDLSFEPPLHDEPPEQWAGHIDQAWFHGAVTLDEVVFFHRPSRTAIFADLSEHFSEAFLSAHWSWWQRPLARLWGIVEGRGYAPLEWRLSWINRAPARKALNKVMAWQPGQVVMAHGEIVRQDAQPFLEHAFHWLR